MIVPDYTPFRKNDFPTPSPVSSNRPTNELQTCLLDRSMLRRLQVSEISLTPMTTSNPILILIQHHHIHIHTHLMIRSLFIPSHPIPSHLYHRSSSLRSLQLFSSRTSQGALGPRGKIATGTGTAVCKFRSVFQFPDPRISPQTLPKKKGKWKSSRSPKPSITQV
jgi:hypothetical protein